MKKSRKITLGIITGVVLAAIAGTLLGIFIPPLLSKQSLEDLVAKQVKPSEGKGNFQEYSLSEEITALPYAEKMQSIEDFSKKMLESESGFNSILSGVINNYIIEFWKNYKDSAAYSDRFDEWIKTINEQWDTEVSNYKKQYGSNWEYYFQLQVLDPAGGNEDDWKRNKLISNVNTAFDDFMFSNYYINAMAENGKDVITSYSNLTTKLQKYLISPELVNGTGGDGTRNNIVFQPSSTQIKLDATSLAKAKFQEFVFMEYVKTELPLITSMTLWKHDDPNNIKYNGYSFFNSEKINQIYSGQYTNISGAATIEDTTTDGSTGSTDGSTDSSTSAVTITTSYDWQAFPVKSSITSSPNGSITINSTDKYNSFTESFNNNQWQSNFILDGTGGINIPIRYTDDSSTLYFIKLSGGTNSVFNTSYTQYAAAATYKFNELLGINDNAMPTTTELGTGINGLSGTEIMSNFLKTTAPTSGSWVQLPDAIKAGINDDASFNFKGFYNGVQYATDTVNITGTPFILSRNESGVHIIGIDRYEKIQAASSYEGKINEIANTLLWRYILTKSGMNNSEYLNNGFSSLDLEQEIKNFYTTYRNQLLFKYILSAQTNSISDDEYIFSSKFTEIPSTFSLTNSIFNDYIQKYLAYVDYKTFIEHTTTVKTKILALQSTNSLINKNFGNSVVSNGIGAIQPYTRNTTANLAPTWDNQGNVNQTYGSYDSLALFHELNSSTPYNEEGLSTLKNSAESAANTLYDSSFKSGIILKKLTYSSAKYNQYVLVGSQNPTSTKYFADDYEILNQALNTWVSSNLEVVKNIVTVQRNLAEINYKEVEETANIKSGTSVFDANNFALTGTYSSITQMNSAPSLPSGGSGFDFVNYYLQKAYDTTKKLSSATGELAQYQDSAALNLDGLYQLARNNWAKTIVADPYSSNALDFIQEVIGIKYAFDYNEKTGDYDFTKFRNYLVQQTENNKKAAFVWVNEERNDLISGYEDLTISQKFSYKVNNNTSTDVHGYIYQGLNNTVASYKDGDLFKPTFTFNDNSSYFTTAPVAYDSTSNFVGYLGMVFQSTSNSDLPSEALTQLFSSELNVYETGKNFDTVISGTAEPTQKGAMYNIGSRDNLVKEIQNGIYTWDAVTKTQLWLNSTFGIDTSAVSQTNLAQAKKDLMNIVQTNTTEITDDLFERNEGAILATNNSLFNSSSMYFGDVNTPGAQLSQVIFTQFNYYDVVKLFDTNGDNELTDEDKGINWSVVSSEGFLGTSADAFFIAAMQWYLSNTSYKTTATAEIDDHQPKFYTYDRRLNDTYGKDLLENYKESV